MWGRCLPLLGMLCLVLAIPLPVHADDGAMFGVGGSLALMKGHPSIRMVSEEVRIALPSTEVEAKFILRNEGPATWVTIGFPESGGGTDYTPDGSSHLQDFHSTVDGERVRVSRISGGKEESGYSYWWVKRVHFSKGQTRTIVNRYTGGEGYDSTGSHHFSYVLKTGASWRGPIGHARIICDISGLKDLHFTSASPDGYRRSGDQLIWDLRNFEPEEDVSVSWFPGYLRVRVNGTSVLKEGQSPISSFGRMPEKRGQELWTAARPSAGWLGAKLRFPTRSQQTLRFSLGERWAEVTAGSAWMATDRGPVRLPAPVRNQWGTIMLPLTSLARALGGQASFDKAGFYQLRTPGTPRFESDE